MKKIRLNDSIFCSTLIDHVRIRDQILSDIDKSLYTDDLHNEGQDYIDNVSKLDWSKSKNLERTWVKKILPYLQIAVQDLVFQMGYGRSKIRDVWYQQYTQGDCHDWHIHGEHFTGVYYLEFPKGSSRTQICSPYDLKGKFINVSEGDFVLFPSHWIHRGGLLRGEKRKPIISFNLLVGDPLNNKLINSVN